jgi:4-amino-4-deoxy-L-arabinose transferase-like glycosyltransferase
VRSPLIWILCLAALSVGAKNFEAGLSVDAPLYAAIARHIVRTGDWFYLYGGTPEFNPFVEHPHLGFWILAAIFKFLPAADWSARIAGHVFYVLFLWSFFTFLEKRHGRNCAIGAVILLWSWFRFANFFSNVYLDPAALFFGMGAVMLCQSRPLLAGISLGLCAMVKGMTVLGFLPALAVSFALVPRAGWKRTTPRFMLGAVFTGMIYVILLSRGSVPDFLARYFRQQLLHRVVNNWNWFGWGSGEFWLSLLSDTHFLILWLFVPIFYFKKDRLRLVPIAGFFGFVLMYSCSGLVGNQYWITVLPWAAWLMATTIPKHWNLRPIVNASAAVSVAAVMFVQYIPVRTHGVQPPGEIEIIKRSLAAQKLNSLILDNFPENPSRGPLYAWYADTEISYADLNLTRTNKKSLLLLLKDNSARKQNLRDKNWCLIHQFGQSSLWNHCDTTSH